MSMRRPDSAAVVVTGMSALSAFGPGTATLADAATRGLTAFAPVTRFDIARRHVNQAATCSGSPDLATELVRVIDDACAQAHLQDGDSATLLLALHSDLRTASIAAEVATGTSAQSAIERVYTGACVASSTAVADAASRIAAGQCDRTVVAAGYLVEADSFAVFDAGRAFARDGQARPFSRERSGLLLGDGVVAIVLESAAVARRRDVPVLARLTGWSRTGDGYHVCRPAPDGNGLARAIATALKRAKLRPVDVGYVNANATGSTLADSAETAALHQVFGESIDGLAVSSTKGAHGHALEASALLELIVTIEALRASKLPVNAGYLGPDDECRLDLILDSPRQSVSRHALCLNSAFGGANTALLVSAA